MSIKSAANLVDSRKNHLKEDVPHFLKEPGKLWGQDTKHQSTLWKTKAVRQVSNNNTKTGIVSCVNQRKMEHTKQWPQQSNSVKKCFFHPKCNNTTQLDDYLCNGAVIDQAC